MRRRPPLTKAQDTLVRHAERDTQPASTLAELLALSHIPPRRLGLWLTHQTFRTRLRKMRRRRPTGGAASALLRLLAEAHARQVVNARHQLPARRPILKTRGLI